MEIKGPKRQDKVIFYVSATEDVNNQLFDILQVLAMLCSFNAIFFKVLKMTTSNPIEQMDSLA